MEFGERHLFAVTIDRIGPPKDPDMPGRLSYWVGGIEIGQDPGTVRLSDVLWSLDRVLYDCGWRADGTLFSLPTETAFWALECANFIHAEAPEALRPLVSSMEIEEARRFSISPGCENFSGWSLYLLEGDDCARLLVKPHGDDRVLEQHLPSGLVDGVLLEVWRQLCEWYEQAVGMEAAWGNGGPPPHRNTGTPRRPGVTKSGS